MSCQRLDCMVVLYRTDVQYYLFISLYNLVRAETGRKESIFQEMNLSETPSRRFVLLAPSSARVPASFRRTETDWTGYWKLLHEMQRLRGKVYLKDGAIDESCLIDGRHRSEADVSSWHLLVMNEQDRICGCARFHEHDQPGVLSELNVGRCALARQPEWSGTLKAALREELTFSADVGRPFVELGGWALGEEIRGTTEALRVALGTYAFWEMLGGAVCISTVTHRHCSASILRRIGGRSLMHQGQEVPPYYDPQYNCRMEILKFYSWAPNPRYRVWIDRLRQELTRITVVARHSHEQDWPYGYKMSHPMAQAQTA